MSQDDCNTVFRLLYDLLTCNTSLDYLLL